MVGSVCKSLCRHLEDMQWMLYFVGAPPGTCHHAFPVRQTEQQVYNQCTLLVFSVETRVCTAHGDERCYNDLSLRCGVLRGAHVSKLWSLVNKPALRKLSNHDNHQFGTVTSVLLHFCRWSLRSSITSILYHFGPRALQPSGISVLEKRNNEVTEDRSALIPL